jgi:hypothetical protein
MIVRAFAFAALLLSAPAIAAPLTVRVGETWTFALYKGEPVKARRVKPAAKPAPGEIKVSVSALMGTTMTVTNASATSYTFAAQLVGAPPGKAAPRTCTLPPQRPTLESWPVKAVAVRLSNFRVAPKGGACR